LAEDSHRFAVGGSIGWRLVLIGTYGWAEDSHRFAVVVLSAGALS